VAKTSLTWRKIKQKQKKSAGQTFCPIKQFFRNKDACGSVYVCAKLAVCVCVQKCNVVQMLSSR